MVELSMGIDSSTQSTTAVFVDVKTGEQVGAGVSIDYLSEKNERFGRHFGLLDNYLLPARVEGEADQPPLLHARALDELFNETGGRTLGDTKIINVSGQQHGHWYLNSTAEQVFQQLRGRKYSRLNVLLEPAFSYKVAPIWRTSNTEQQAEEIALALGGIIPVSGSRSPRRFTGAVVRRVGQQFPDAYKATARIHLIGNAIPAVLVGSTDIPADFANASGMSLMNYTTREWDSRLVQAVSDGLPGGAEALLAKLPRLVAPDTIVGDIAQYFTFYGVDPSCKVMVGSGDNLQTKVLTRGDLLSIGSSIVNMVSSTPETRDWQGYANCMYDGIGRPFMFGCRTNGVLVWDKVREEYGLQKTEYGPAEAALAKTAPGSVVFLWQPENESFPRSDKHQQVRFGYAPGSLEKDYPGIIDATLAAVYLYSKEFTRETNDPLYVTGGPSMSPGILRRIAGIWNRPVVPIGTVGAALGAAVAGAYALQKSRGGNPDIEALSAAAVPRHATINPEPHVVAAYHGEWGYLKKFQECSPYKKLS